MYPILSKYLQWATDWIGSPAVSGGVVHADVDVIPQKVKRITPAHPGKKVA